jgi:anti-sigma B factor antagonist
MHKYIKTDKQLTCILSGKIDTLNSVTLENDLTEQMTAEITSVLFDIESVDYVSSTFLRIVITLVKSLGKENFSIINVQPSVTLVFKIAGLSEIIKSK